MRHEPTSRTREMSEDEESAGGMRPVWNRQGCGSRVTITAHGGRCTSTRPHRGLCSPERAQSEFLGGKQPRQPGLDAGEAMVGGGGQGGAPPQLAHLTAERREIGLRPLARARQRRSGCAAVAFLSNDLHDEVDRECDTDVSERHLCQRRSRQ